MEETSSTSRQNEKPSCESITEETNDDGCKAKNGASSSNSTVEESEQKKSSVRPYVRSKIPRLRWTPDLHLRFLHAVERLGGQDKATPKLVLQMMNIKGLSIAHVKSHLQMYRSKKIDSQGQVLADHRHHLEGGEGNIYNLSQLPMLQGYNHRHSPTFSKFPRYGDISWNGNQPLMYNSFVHGSSSEIPRARIYERVHDEKAFGGKDTLVSSHSLNSTIAEHSTWTMHQLKDEPKSYFSHKLLKGPQSLPSPQEFSPQAELKDVIKPSEISTARALQEMKAMKRKASDCDFNLDLSLKLTPLGNDRNMSSEDSETDNNLSLALCSSSSSKFNKLDSTKQQYARRASTLDLSL